MLIETCGFESVEEYYQSMDKCREINSKFEINKTQNANGKLYINLDLGRDED